MIMLQHKDITLASMGYDILGHPAFYVSTPDKVATFVGENAYENAEAYYVKMINSIVYP